MIDGQCASVNKELSILVHFQTEPDDVVDEEELIFLVMKLLSIAHRMT